MNILGALYAGRQGILRAKESIDLRAAKTSLNVEDVAATEVDKAQLKASARVVQVSGEIFHELVQLGEKK